MFHIQDSRFSTGKVIKGIKLKYCHIGNYFYLHNIFVFALINKYVDSTSYAVAYKQAVIFCNRSPEFQNNIQYEENENRKKKQIENIIVVIAFA